MAITRTKMEPSRRQLGVKLDKAMKLLDDVMKAMNKGDSDLSPSLRKKMVARWKVIEHGKVSLHRYKSLHEFDRSVS